MTRPLPIAVFLSGEGTTFDALAEAIAGGHLPARIAMVLADRPHAPGIERARHHGLPTAVRPIRGRTPEGWTSEVSELLEERGVALIVLAGFLSILPEPFVHRWSGRIINVHPSLLPEHGGRGMFGLRVHGAVLEARETESGATVHLVTDQVDGGPRLLQERVPVSTEDTPESLRDRVRPVERRLLAEVIRRFADGEWPLPYPVAGAQRSRPSGRDAP
ncbi:MAG TPA: phosphoribosylglycinamide formyltransferase [Thermoplasmata archaeon]|nr:phosphoribosylglycinamide formyltransferase [Thermoplasmata archaeon]